MFNRRTRKMRDSPDVAQNLKTFSLKKMFGNLPLPLPLPLVSPLILNSFTGFLVTSSALGKCRQFLDLYPSSEESWRQLTRGMSESVIPTWYYA